MKKNTVKLNEAQLRNIVAESVKRCLTEIIDPYDGNPNLAVHWGGPQRDAHLNQYGYRYDPLTRKAVPIEGQAQQNGTTNETKEEGNALGKYEDDNYLGVSGANRAFGSDENYITVSIPFGSGLKQEMNEKMLELGYQYQDSGANGNKIMLTYKKIGI